MFVLYKTSFISIFVTDLEKLCCFMENPDYVYYIASAVTAILAIITATGKIDSLYCKKYLPIFKNGKFVMKPINYNPKRMRPLSVVLLLLLSLLLISVPVCGVPEFTIFIAVLSCAVVFGVIATVWALEKE